MFLDGDGAVREISKLIADSAQPRLAVAFWGGGAAEKLGLLQAGSRATVICNLGTGGTNPDEIRRLIDNHVKVFRLDDLHAKVYLGDGIAVLGSSNASANGLAMQGQEQSGWREANILIRQNDIIQDIETWWQNLLPLCRPVSLQELPGVKPNWQRHRSISPSPQGSSRDLFSFLAKSPELLADRRLQVLVYERGLSAEAASAETEFKLEMGNKWGGFEDWDIPEGDAIVFYLGRRDGFYYDNCYRFREPPECLTPSGVRVIFGRRISGLSGFETRGLDASWKAACLKLRDSEFWTSDGTACIDLGEFGRRFVAR